MEEGGILRKYTGGWNVWSCVLTQNSVNVNQSHQVDEKYYSLLTVWRHSALLTLAPNFHIYDLYHMYIMSLTLRITGMNNYWTHCWPASNKASFSSVGRASHQYRGGSILLNPQIFFWTFFATASVPSQLWRSLSLLLLLKGSVRHCNVVQDNMQLYFGDNFKNPSQLQIASVIMPCIQWCVLIDWL